MESEKKNPNWETEKRPVFARGGGREWEKCVKVVRRLQTSSYKINKFWGCNVQDGDDSYQYRFPQYLKIEHSHETFCKPRWCKVKKLLP